MNKGHKLALFELSYVLAHLNSNFQEDHPAIKKSASSEWIISTWQGGFLSLRAKNDLKQVGRSNKSGYFGVWSYVMKNLANTSYPMPNSWMVSRGYKQEMAFKMLTCSVLIHIFILLLRHYYHKPALFMLVAIFLTFDQNIYLLLEIIQSKL